MGNLLFIESFDHLSAAQTGRKWTLGGSGSIVPGRTNNGYASNALNFPSKTLNAEYSTLTMGVAFKASALANPIIRFNGPDSQVDLDSVGDGRLKLTFGLTGGGGFFSSPPSSFVMSAGVWYYFELQAEITGASPTHVPASARVNGAEILSYDYTHSGTITNKKLNRVTVVGPGGVASVIDDVYVTDTEFLGDVRIGVLYPNAAGDSAAWMPTPAGNNWQQVEEHPADDDATYVSTPTVGAKDLYNLDDIDPAFTGAIKGVQALWCVKKSDEGAGAVKGVWKSGATEIVQAGGHNFLAPNGFHPSAVDYLYDIQTERSSLFTATAWTPSEINSLQLGITRTL